MFYQLRPKPGRGPPTSILRHCPSEPQPSLSAQAGRPHPRTLGEIFLAMTLPARFSEHLTFENEPHIFCFLHHPSVAFSTIAFNILITEILKITDLSNISLIPNMVCCLPCLYRVKNNSNNKEYIYLPFSMSSDFAIENWTCCTIVVRNL